MQSINYNNQFYQVVIGGSISGLDDENIIIVYVFIDLYVDFVVVKMIYSGVVKRSVQVVGNMLCQFWGGVISKKFYIRYEKNFRYVFSGG